MPSAEGDKKPAEASPKALKKSFYVTNHGSVKRKISIAVDPEVYDKFLKAVVETEGSIKAVGKVLGQLMLKYAEEVNGRGQNAMIRVNSLHKLRKILEYIAAKRGESLSELVYNQVTESELKEAIMNTIGSDERTIKKYISLLLEMKIIQHRAGFLPRRVFEIVRTP